MNPFEWTYKARRDEVTREEFRHVWAEHGMVLRVSVAAVDPNWVRFRTSSGATLTLHDLPRADVQALAAHFLQPVRVRFVLRQELEATELDTLAILSCLPVDLPSPGAAPNTADLERGGSVLADVQRVDSDGSGSRVMLLLVGSGWHCWEYPVSTAQAIVALRNMGKRVRVVLDQEGG